MRLKQLIGSLIFLIFLNICVKAQFFFNFNTVPSKNQQVSTIRNVNNNNNNNAKRTSIQPLQRTKQQQQNARVTRQQPIIQQQNARVTRQQPLIQQQNRPAQNFLQQISGPKNENQIDTIIIIETESQNPTVRPNQKKQTTQNSSRRPQTQTTQLQRQPQSSKPLQTQQNQRPTNTQSQTQQNQRPGTQTQAQQTQRPRPQTQTQQTQRPGTQTQTQQNQRPREQQTQQTQRPREQQTQQNQRQPTRPSSQRPQQIQAQQQSQNQQQQQEYYQQQQTQYQRPTHEDAPIVFPGYTNNPHRPTEETVGFVKPNNPFLNPTTASSTLTQGFSNNGNNFNNLASNNAVNPFGNTVASNNINNFNNLQNQQNFGFNNDGSTNFVSASSNAFVNIDGNNGLGAATNNFENNFNGAGINNGPYNNNYNVDPNRWYNPHRPNGNYYQNFATIFNDIDQKAENDYNISEENNEMNDDFNGRSVVSPGQYPHMAALGYRTSSGDTEFKCGGSLISEMYILTAAHCCFLNGQAPHLAKIGDINLKEFEHDIIPQRRGIARVIKHPYYNSSMHYHDIGLLELTNAIEFTFFVRPIRLWARDEIPYSKLFTMGYGSTSFAQAPTNVLTELDLQVVPLDSCNKTLPTDPNAPYGLLESQICARDFEKNRDTCQGDSGGPLQLNLIRPRRRRLRYYLVGVISYGTFCRSQYPGVYTRVSSYIDWIASVVWPTYLNGFQI